MIVATISALVTSSAWPLAREPHAVGRLRPWPARAAGICAAGTLLALALFWAVPKYRAEETRRDARVRIDRMAAESVDVSREAEKMDSIRTELSAAVAMDPANAQALSDQAYADSLWALVKPGETIELGTRVESEARRAVGLCPVVAEFWIRLGTGLDMQRRWLEGGQCFALALKLAPERADVWYYEAYHLSLAPNETGPALAAADFCLRLDPGFALAQSLRQRLGARE